jgi:membrane-bound lytic murein transglycosylase D
MLKRILFFTLLFVSLFTVIKLLSFRGVLVMSEQEYIEEFQHNYRVYALPIPDELLFAGERVPLSDTEVRERFDRELLVNTYWQSQTLLFFKRANRWFPVIEPILKENGVPDDFKYLALIESGLMNVVSPANATGFWQILEATGRELGLEVTQEIDERYHVEKSTVAACKYLLGVYNHYGSWAMAAASYNMGRAGLNRQVTNQRSNNYYDLWLNEETSRYVFRILAIKTIFENPQAASFYFREADLYEPYEFYTVKVDTNIRDMVAFAHHHQVSYKELRMLNPWLRQYTLTNPRKKTYEIKILKNSRFGLEEPEPQVVIPTENDLEHPGYLEQKDPDI